MVLWAGDRAIWCCGHEVGEMVLWAGDRARWCCGLEIGRDGAVGWR